MGPIITTLDIETAPIKACVWGQWKQNIGNNMIEKDWSVLSVAWKQLGHKKTHYKDVADMVQYNDDIALMHVIWTILDESDIIVGQNAKKFDIRKINARLLELGFPPPRPYKIVDTLLAARAVAAFTSNKLEWLAAILTDTRKDQHKMFSGFELWEQCMLGNPRAWKAMKRYNLQDIPTCEAVYLRLRPWVIGHPNVAMYYDDEKTRCPRCASIDLTLLPTRVYTQSGSYEHYRCNGCGGFARGRYTTNSKAKRKASLSC